jgi:hypothetical protein
MPGITSTMHGKTRKPTPLTAITSNAWSVLFTMVLFLQVPSARAYIAANATVFINA